MPIAPAVAAHPFLSSLDCLSKKGRCFERPFMLAMIQSSERFLDIYIRDLMSIYRDNYVSIVNYSRQRTKATLPHLNTGKELKKLRYDGH
mgnify:CR=1 FL=1